MADSFPPPDPFVPATVDPPVLVTPVPEPLVGEGSPFAVADAENRDRILDWWRAWWLRVFFPWIKAFIGWVNSYITQLAAYLNTWIVAASEYITLHAVNGHSDWVTQTALNRTLGQTTTATLPYDEYRPLLVGDVVTDTSIYTTWGQITAVIDDTHATVATLGAKRGATGYGWWTTTTAITQSGDTTNVLLPVSADRQPQLNDLVVDNSTQSAYGKITAIIDATHATVTYIHNLQGPPGSGGGGGGGVESVQAGAHIAVDATDPANPIVAVTGMPIGIPSGGSTGYALEKLSGADYDADWRALPDSMIHPASPGFAGQVLTKFSNLKGQFDWENVVNPATPVTFTTPGGAFFNGTITAGSKLLNLFFASSSAATQRLRVYRSIADRTADAARAAGTAPDVRGICLAEFIWNSGDTGGTVFYTEGLELVTNDATPGQLFYRVDSGAASDFTIFLYGVGNV